MKIISAQQLLVKASPIIFQENLSISLDPNTRPQTEQGITSRTAKLHDIPEGRRDVPFLANVNQSCHLCFLNLQSLRVNAHEFCFA
jgi:hypothetical protein